MLKESVWYQRENWVTFPSGINRSYIDVAPTCSVIVLYSVLLAVVKPFFVTAGYRPTLCVNLFGRSGVGKTRLVRAMGQLTENLESFWGSMLNDRRNEVLNRIVDAYGGIFVLDDFHPTVTGHTLDRQLDIMNAVIRKIESVPKSPVVFMTSEMLGGEYSMQDRMLQVCVDKVDNNLMCQIENAPYYLPEQALVFVKKLLENYTQALEDIKQMYQKLNSVKSHSDYERGEADTCNSIWAGYAK